MKTIHKPLIYSVERILISVFRQKIFADKAIEFEFKNNKQFGSRDRAFIAETAYDIIRYYRYYAFLIDHDEKYFDLISAYLWDQKVEFPDWINVSETKLEFWKKRRQTAERIRKIKESVPDWIDEIGDQIFHEEWPILLHSLNQKAALVIRTNTLKTTKSNLLKELDQQNIEYQLPSDQLYPDAIIIKRQNIFSHTLFKEGKIEIQDASSQMIAPFLQVKPGMRTADACAGAGGKSLHLAALMNNKGSIISMDTDSNKLEELKKRARRNGVHIIETRTIESSKTIKRLYEKFDRLLLDVPCSGMGVLRRNPDAKWKLDPQFVETCIDTQTKILDQYHKMLKPGGKMVYATCSILPTENQNQVKLFLDKNPQFELEEEQTQLPHIHGFDGFYMARLIRKS